jgi:hypothetical protein
MASAWIDRSARPWLAALTSVVVVLLLIRGGEIYGAGAVAITVTSLLFVAIAVLAVEIILGQRKPRVPAEHWPRRLPMCEHTHCKMYVSDVGPIGSKGRYVWVVCLDCLHNLTGGPLRVGDSPERGWR